MTYGYEVQRRDDRMLDASKRMSNLGQEIVLPGVLLVNYIPFRMKSLLFHGSIDLLHTLQYATSLNGCHG
jgi:hypothetical protein